MDEPMMLIRFGHHLTGDCASVGRCHLLFPNYGFSAPE